jgi:hypothetical protein
MYTKRKTESSNDTISNSGRDVALSNNQSPVMKFYDTMYPNHEERKKIYHGDLWNVRAIQLWNDWNVQVNDWATSSTITTTSGSKRYDRKNHNNNHDHDGIDYLWMRSEDLLPGSPLRFECLQKLAQFVGSTLTPEELCCLSQQGPRDYGKSIVHDPRKVSSILDAASASSSRSIEAQWIRQERDKVNNAKRREGGRAAAVAAAEVVDRKVLPSQEEFAAREASLKEKEESLRQWQAALEAREAGLNDWKIKAGLQQNMKNSTVVASTKSRRRLQQDPVRTPRAKIVPSNFLRDSGIWLGLAHTALEKDADVTRIFIVDGLISHGEDLLQQWELNHFDDQAATFDGIVSKHKIQSLVLKLQIKLQQAQLIAHRRKKLADRPGDTNVTNRYGKWQGVLSNNTQLAQYFYQEGKEGLERFGYHPYREMNFTDAKATTGDGNMISETFNESTYARFVCNSAVSCPSSTEAVTQKPRIDERIPSNYEKVPWLE